ncbi:MAG: (E)-4-hydroxy-3-methylbut-2-enyl-diphosphate synthase [Bacteroidales bacterium]|nr:(E)-4-hydroxy-3-methylbut-2-enyl-diphosphate synthase [Bacteroidales bacterium]
MLNKNADPSLYFSNSAFLAKEVNVGKLILGGNHPLVIQSMTNTNTLDTPATVEQAIRIIEAGGELVRCTAQGEAEAENLKEIKKELLTRGYDTPLAADIHFSSRAAEIAAQYVDKVRINPGNYAERNTKSNFSEQEYQTALAKTAQKLKPLISLCKKHKTAIRIGVNHGSLSNRIMSRYGNTPLGMVESAMEFVRIFEAEDFDQIIISLKSSNVLSMLHANRLLAYRMVQNNRIYPIHLGVTEAGNGIEGRQKSIAGIAALLGEGIGNTLRVSLTEAPENEIPIAIQLRSFLINNKEEKKSVEFVKKWTDPFTYSRRASVQVNTIGAKNPPLVIAAATQSFSCKVPRPKRGETYPEADFLYIGNEKPVFLPEEKNYIQDFGVWNQAFSNCFPLLNANDLLQHQSSIEQMFFVRLTPVELHSNKIIKALAKFSLAVLVLTANTENPIAEWRNAFYILDQNKLNLPVILHRKFAVEQVEDLLIKATHAFASLLLDGFGDGIWIEDAGGIHLFTQRQMAFGVLQACRLRLSQTDYIACPSCGRTLFDIEERLEEIRQKTKHLKHLKIAMMGCIVNGLGEMADADYGYVGSGVGKVNLYKGKVLKRKNIPEKEAAEALVDLIKTEGDWKDPD